MKITNLDSNVMAGQGPQTPPAPIPVGMGSDASLGPAVPMPAALPMGAQPPPPGSEPPSLYATVIPPKE